MKRIGFDLIVNALKQKVSESKVTFLSGLIIGFSAQGIALTNTLFFHDGINCMFNVGATVSSGRWMLGIISQVFDKAFGIYELPLLNGLVSLIFLSLTACVLANFLRLQKLSSKILIGALFTSFPSVTCLFGYMFTAPYYCLAILMITIGSVLIAKKKHIKYMALGIILIACSIGIYQPYLSFVLIVFSLYLIKLIVDSASIKEVTKEILRLACCLIISLVAYFVITKLIFIVTNTGMSDYKGGSSFIASPYDYFIRIIQSIKYLFIITDPNLSYFISGPGVCYYLILFFVLVFTGIITYKLWKSNKLNASLFFVLSIALFVSINFVYVMCGKGDIYSLMLFGQMVLYVYGLWLSEYVHNEYTLKNSRILQALYACVLCIVIALFVRNDNVCYLKATLTQQQAISYYNRLITNMTATDDYSEQYPVVFIGNNIEDSSFCRIEQFEKIKLKPYLDMAGYVNNYARKKFIKYYCGYDPVYLDEEEMKYRVDIKEMPCYPNKGSIRIIDNKLVVKFSNE